MNYELKNSEVTATINYRGAELKSVKKNNVEYMWSADERYWNRTSPVLFPFVGSLKNKCFTINGVKYPMNQHGFARDCDFELEEETDNSVSFVLKSNEETIKMYPFEFMLRIIYILDGRKITVRFEVENPANKEMYFSIGAHPGFVCPIDGDKRSDYKLYFDTDKDVEYMLAVNSLLDKSKVYKLQTDNGYVDIKDDMFDRDALLIDGSKVNKISICRPDGKPYVTVEANNAPLIGVWSTENTVAPFVCIEPWNGACDTTDFDGELKDKAYSNTLAAGEKFSTEYTMEFM